MTDKTVTIQRANVILTISESQLEYYMTQGYNLIDERGHILKASVPKDLGTLQKAYVDHEAEIRALKVQITELTKKLNAKQQRTAKKQEN